MVRRRVVIKQEQVTTNLSCFSCVRSHAFMRHRKALEENVRPYPPASSHQRATPQKKHKNPAASASIVHAVAASGPCSTTSLRTRPNH